MPPKSLFMRIAREILWSRPPGPQNTPFFSWAFVYGPLCPWQFSWANDYGPPCPCEICGPRSRREAPKSLFMHTVSEISVSRPPGASGSLQTLQTPIWETPQTLQTPISEPPCMHANIGPVWISTPETVVTGRCDAVESLAKCVRGAGEALSRQRHSVVVPGGQ